MAVATWSAASRMAPHSFCTYRAALIYTKSRGYSTSALSCHSYRTTYEVHTSISISTSPLMLGLPSCLGTSRSANGDERPHKRETLLSSSTRRRLSSSRFSAVVVNAQTKLYARFDERANIAKF